MSHINTIKDADRAFVIDAQSRQIRNTSRKLFLIQKDHKSERLSFSIPRYIEGHDMIESVAEVHYINIETQTRKTMPGMYEILDLHVDETDESKLLGTWLISNNATGLVGSLVFLIVFKCHSVEGVLEYQWSTDTAKSIIIKEGMDNTGAVEPELEPDILAQWREALFSANAEGVENINTAKTAALAEIQTEKEAVLSTSEQAVKDVQTAQAEAIIAAESATETAGKAKKDIAEAEQSALDAIGTKQTEAEQSILDKETAAKTAISESGASATGEIEKAEANALQAVTDAKETAVAEVEGLTGALNDKTAKEIRDVVANAITGTASGEVIRVDDVSPIEHTVKAKVGGKNFIDISKITSSRIVYNDDNTLSVTSITDSFSAPTGKTLRQLAPNMRAGQIYTLSAITDATKSASKKIYLNHDDGSYSWMFGTSVVVTDRMLDSVAYFYANDNENITTISNIQIELGDTATEYEPYIDPTSVEVTACGKNLLRNDVTTFTFHNVTFTTNADGSITCNGTATQNATCRLTGNYSLPKGEYIVRGCPSGGSPETYRLQVNKVVDGVEKTGGIDSGVSAMLHITEECLVYPYIVILKGVTVPNVTFYPQLQFARDTDTTYEPYKGATYTPNADGTVELVSVSPTMTIFTDTTGANIEAEYNRDTNAFAEDVSKDIAELDRVTAELIEDMGDVSSALDELHTYAQALIGGDA